MQQFLLQAKDSALEKLNALQQKTLRWWLAYKVSLQFQVADVIHSLLNDTAVHTANNKRSTTPRTAALHKIWIDTMIRQHREAACPKRNLHVTWMHSPDYSWEYGVTFDRYLGLVDSGVR